MARKSTNTITSTTTLESTIIQNPEADLGKEISETVTTTEKLVETIVTPEEKVNTIVEKNLDKTLKQEPAAEVQVTKSTVNKGSNISSSHILVPSDEILKTPKISQTWIG